MRAGRARAKAGARSCAFTRREVRLRPPPSRPGSAAEGRWSKPRAAGSMTFARLFLAAALLMVRALPEAGTSAASRFASPSYLSAAPRGPAPKPPRSPPLQPQQPAGGGGCPRNGGRFVNVTEFGAGCLPWAEVPTFLERTPQGKGLRGQRNFCRNPDGRSRPWCFYRNNRGRVDWGYCDCRQGEAGSPRQLSFLAGIGRVLTRPCELPLPTRVRALKGHLALRRSDRYILPNIFYLKAFGVIRAYWARTPTVNACN